MIPTMLLVGLLVGRRWVILVGAIGWAATLLAGGIIGAADAPFAAGLAAANAAVGVGVRWFLTLWARSVMSPMGR